MLIPCIWAEKKDDQQFFQRILLTFVKNSAVICTNKINCKSKHCWYLNFAGQEVSTTSSKESVKLSNSRILRRKKSNYKHVPHCEKPPQVVAKRNARERRRVQAVNQAFIQLRKAIPIESKVKTSNCS